MHIVRLQIKNFLSISDAEIRPGQVNQIVGANNQGKTTVLRAIETAIRGSSDGSLVKRGETEAEIVVEFDNNTHVRRRIYADGTQDVAVKKDDFKAGAPQSVLNGLFDQTAFNPLDLLDPKRRTEALLKSIDLRVTEETIAAAVGADCPVPIPPLDYSLHGLRVAEQAHRYFYQRRAEVNKDAKAKSERYRVAASELPTPPEMPTDLRSEAEIRATIEKARADIAEENSKGAVAEERKSALAALNAKAVQVGQRSIDLAGRIARLAQELESSRAALADVEADRLELVKEQEEAAVRIAEVAVDQVRVDALNLHIQRFQDQLTLRAQIAAFSAAQKRVADLEAEAAGAEMTAEKISKVVDSLGSSFRSALMSKTELPIPGLTYENDQFFLDGSSIDNLSSSKSLQLAVAVARKLAGQTKLICIDGAEMLDEESYKALRSEIGSDGFTYFITKVGEPFANAGDQVVRMAAGAVSK